MSAAPASSVCRELRLRQFRNFEELDLAFPPEGAAVIGDNGSGKTNLLEALYYLEIFRSFRSASDAQLVRFGADAFFVRGVFEERPSGEVVEVTAAYERKTRRKRVRVDGAETERLSDALGRIGAIVFSPSDVTLVTGSPGERRRFLDIVLSLNRTGYLPALRRYRKILRRRNAMLRDGADAALLAAWNEGLVEAGARVMADRADWIETHREGFGERYREIGGGPAAELHYAPSVTLEGASDAETTASGASAAFRSELERTAERERDRGMTLTGPHRDDFDIEVRGEPKPLDLRRFGSGGQQRTAAIALRMTEAETVRRSRGRDPMILLDDIFAELDPGRAGRLLDLLEEREPGQVILTAPKASDVEVRQGALPRWRIRDGEVVT